MFSFRGRKPRRTGDRPVRSTRPRIEMLEDRSVPAGGVLDPTFGSGGAVISPLLPMPAVVATYPQVGTANDGKIVVAGHDRTNGGRDEFAVARYNPDGSPDTSFANGGEAFGPLGWAQAVAIQPDGKILAAGTSGNAFAVVRYKTNGTLDTTFGSRGVATTTIAAKGTDEIWALGLQADGKIVVAGGTTPAHSTTRQLALVRYNANGSLDTTFGSGGKALDHLATTALALGDTQGMGLAIDPGTGQIVVEMASPESTPYPAMLVRYTGAGVLDTSFAGTGYETLDGTAGLPSMWSRATVAIQSSEHRIVVAGTGYGLSQSIARLNTDGTLADSRTVVGITRGGVNSVVIQADGGILVGATGAPTTIVVTRYNPDLTIDTSFGKAGVASYATSAPRTSVAFESMALEPDGRIVVAGFYEGTTSEVVLARFLMTGPRIGSLTASPAGGGGVTLTASDITDGNPGAIVAQVSFYYFDPGGTKVNLGGGIPDGSGAWSVDVTLPPGTTVYAQAEDSLGAFGDPADILL